MKYEEIDPHFTDSKTRRFERSTEPADLLNHLTYDPDSGAIHRIGFREKVATRIGHGGYLYLYHQGLSLLAHRVAFAMGNGVWPVNQVDHIDGDRTNNKLNNLADVTRSENNCNTDKARGLTPAQAARGGKLMVGLTKTISGRYRARFKYQNVQYDAGTHDSPSEAQAARRAMMARVGRRID
jgi:hypothetical protein